MNIQFVKNIQFTRLIKAEGRLREFNFRKLGGLNEGLFTVDVVDDRGNRIMMRMQKEDESWRVLSQPVPAWVSKYEHVLHECIEEELV
jgi:hypothetical protein